MQENNDPFQQSADFWFADGSVVLQAEQTRFRVHKGVLARHSPFFEDLFNLPLTVNQPCLDGVPIVQVMADTAEDWKCILTMLYESVNALESTLGVHQALSLVRISQKYLFDAIHVFAMRRLQETFPTKYEDFTVKYSEHLWCEVGKDFCDCGEVCDPYDVVKVINYAVRWDILAVLPVAYYLLSGISVEEVLRGVRARYGIAEEQNLSALLNSYAQLSLLRGRYKLENKFYDRVFPWVAIPGKGDVVGSPTVCVGNPADCKHAFHDRHESDAHGWDHPERTLSMLNEDAPSQWFHIFWRQPTGTGLCEGCTRAAEHHLHATRAQLWDELPQIYGLPSWENLASANR